MSALLVLGEHKKADESEIEYCTLQVYIIWISVMSLYRGKISASPYKWISGTIGRKVILRMLKFQGT